MSGQMRQISDLEFADQVGAASGPMVVAFFATWCGNCRQLAPVLDRVAAEYAGRVRFVKINVDENPAAVAAYGVSSTPTLVALVDGRPVAAPLVGAHPESVLRDWLITATQSPVGSAGSIDQRGWVPADACRLPTAEQPLRVTEFGRLFCTAMLGMQRLSSTRLRLELDATAEATARDLAARETDCCTFFTFTLTQTGQDTIEMDIQVPDDRQDVLDGLAEHASTAARAA